MEGNSNEGLAILISPISAPKHSQVVSLSQLDTEVQNNEPQVTFRDLFLENFDIVKSRLSKSKTLLEGFISLCKLRVSQESHSADLTGNWQVDAPTGNILSPEESNVACSVDLLSANVTKRASQSRQFVEDVMSEVVEPIERAKGGHDRLYESLDKDGSRLSKTLQSEYKAHDDALIQFDRAQRAARACLQSSALLRSEPSKYIAAGMACRESVDREQAYHRSVFRVNQIREEYMETMSVILTQLEDLELSRLHLIKDGVEKMFIFELALNRGNQYEIESCFKEIEKLSISVSRDISKFMREFGDKAASSSLRHGDVKIISSTDIARISSSDDSSERVFTNEASGDITSAEQKIIDLIWNQQELHVDVMEALDEAFSNRPGRLSFCRAISRQQPELLSGSCMTSLGKVLNKVLTAAETELDADAGRWVAGFSTKFYFSENGRKKYCQSEIYHHGIWNRIQFWEEALALVIADEFIGDFTNTVAATQTVTIDKFGNYLLIFGINANSATDICKRVVSRDFSNLSPDARDHLTQRLISSVRSAQERQERNIALLTQQNSRVPSPTISVYFNSIFQLLYMLYKNGHLLY
jgi:hypothetical protein